MSGQEMAIAILNSAAHCYHHGSPTLAKRMWMYAQGLERFQQLAGSKKPDVVIFSSLLLEMRRMAEFSKDELKTEFLSVETVQRFMNRTTALLTKIEVLGKFQSSTVNT